MRINHYGEWQSQPDTTGMMFPAQCRYCQGVYDLANVEVTARYADCSMWKSPCCNRQVDDRKWKSSPDYVEIRRA